MISKLLLVQTCTAFLQLPRIMNSRGYDTMWYDRGAARADPSCRHLMRMGH